MAHKIFQAEITATNNDVINDHFLFEFSSGQHGRLELEGGPVLKKGETGKAMISLDKPTGITLNEKFNFKRDVDGGPEGIGEVIDIVE